MSVILIGYRGSGKTTLGRRLAAAMRWSFADLDERIVEQTGLSIKAIFAEHGESGFRAIETEQLSRLLQLQDHVISLGGGAVLAEVNRAAIRSSGHAVVYLQARPEVLHQRIAADPATAANRPGLTHLGGSVDEVRTLLAQREPIYRQLAHVELDVNTMPTGALAEKLVTQLRVALSKK